MRAPVALLSLRLSPTTRAGAIETDDDALSHGLDRLLVLIALADAALDSTSGAWRLRDHLAMPRRVTVGALAGVATRESQTWGVPLLVGGAAAWLGQKAERDCRHELISLGLPPIMVGLAEEAVALSLPFLWRRWPALGLASVPVAAGLIVAARARKVRRYVMVRAGPRHVPLGRQLRPSPGGASPSGPSSPWTERGVRPMAGAS